ncbi:unnamed protein product [Cylicocyclus nassatus]|uniref:Superoxide dismutase [Cu-Zn] n=1 Tax=Cylicocyclus nassatus TaxID=53992 RepID=A0AA36GYC8_CYLNA|nr:unnamed protein product [Cylicocyclus nassatus]
MLVTVFLLLAGIHLLDSFSLPDRYGDAKAYAVMYRAVPDGDPIVPIGIVYFTEIGNVVVVEGTLYGLSPGPHGFHVHEEGSLGNGCLDAGGHFNPTNETHGAPSDEIRHVGDLGNVYAQNGGIAVIYMHDPVISLTGDDSIVGKSLVIHEGGDDLGLGSDPSSQETGNSGGRFGCGIIVAR